MMRKIKLNYATLSAKKIIYKTFNNGDRGRYRSWIIYKIYGINFSFGKNAYYLVSWLFFFFSFQTQHSHSLFVYQRTREVLHEVGLRNMWAHSTVWWLPSSCQPDRYDLQEDVVLSPQRPCASTSSSSHWYTKRYPIEYENLHDENPPRKTIDHSFIWKESTVV